MPKNPKADEASDTKLTKLTADDPADAGAPETPETSEATDTPAPKVSAEESILQAASGDVEDEDQAGPKIKKSRSVVGGSPKKSHKKLWLSVLAVIVLAGVIAGVVLLVKKPAKVDAPKAASDTPAVAQEVSASYLPNTVPYAYRGADADPYTIYYRPAGGGERKEVMKLERDEYASVMDTVGSTVVFGSDTKLYVSQDSGKSYKTLYTAASGEAINSVKISFEGTRVAVATVPDFSNQSKGVVFSVGLDGKSKKSLFDDPSALYLIGWSDKKQSMAYWQGCYACDGGRTGWKLRDLKANTAKDLVAGMDSKTFYHNVAISSDMTKLMYVETTYDAAIETEGPPGYYAAAPYKVFEGDLVSRKSGLVATVGAKKEKNTNGTDKVRVLSVGFLAGTNTGYYAEGTKVYKVADYKASLFYQTDQDISAVNFASDKTIITSTGNLNSGDYALASYDLAAKKSTPIFQGDANTALFGVTTK